MIMIYQRRKIIIVLHMTMMKMTFMNLLERVEILEMMQEMHRIENQTQMLEEVMVEVIRRNQRKKVHWIINM